MRNQPVGVCLLLCLAALGPATSQDQVEPGPSPIQVVDETGQLAEALRTAQVIYLRLPLGVFTEQATRAVLTWVANGGRLVTDGDVVGLFGFRTEAPTSDSRLGQARRSCALGASPLTAGVETVWYDLGPTGVYLLSHPTALPLLTEIDPPQPRQSNRFVAAELWFGRGQVIHRPAVVHPGRGDGGRWLQNLQLVLLASNSDVGLHPDRVAELLAEVRAAAETLADQPAAVKARLHAVLLICQLWYANSLMDRAQWEEARSQLAAVSAVWPERPEVYQAVARLNEAVGRRDEAAEARRRADQGFAAAGGRAPRADDPQVRVPWQVFVGLINAAGAAWHQPTPASVAELDSRLAYLAGLYRARRNQLDEALALFTAAASRHRGWGLPLYHGGLVQYQRASERRQPAATMAETFRKSAAWFAAAKACQPSVDFDAAAASQAGDWQTVAEQAARVAASEPPAVDLRGPLIFRYDSADQRLARGPLFDRLRSAFIGAHELTRTWGRHLTDIEILVYPDGPALQAALPTDGVGWRAFSQIASVGRRVYVLPRETDIGRMARHETARVFCAALTADGLPAPLWFTEGLAVHAQQETMYEQLGRQWLRGGRALTIEQLADPANLYHPQFVDRVLGQCLLMVQPLLERYPPATFVTPFLEACGWGTQPDQAFAARTQLTQQQYLGYLLQGRLSLR